MKWKAVFGVALLVWISSVASHPVLSGQAPTGQPGDPLAGLTPREFTEFRLGLDDFTEVETAEEGLGPAFNGTSCAVCHNVPAIGGAGIILETRAGYRNADGSFRGLNDDGDTFDSPVFGADAWMPAADSRRCDDDCAAGTDSAVWSRAR